MIMKRFIPAIFFAIAAATVLADESSTPVNRFPCPDASAADAGTAGRLLPKLAPPADIVTRPTALTLLVLVRRTKPLDADSVVFDVLIGGEKVSFEIEPSPKGPRANRVQLSR